MLKNAIEEAWILVRALAVILILATSAFVYQHSTMVGVQADLEKALQKNEELRGVIAEAKKSHSEKDAIIAQNQADIVEYKETLKLRNEEVAQLETVVKDTKGKVTDLNKQLKELSTKFKTFESDILSSLNE